MIVARTALLVALLTMAWCCVLGSSIVFAEDPPETTEAMSGSDKAFAFAVPDSIVAVVAGDTLTQSEFTRWYTRSGAQTSEAQGDAPVPGDMSGGATSGGTSPESPEAFLQRYVNFRLKVTAAEDAELDTLSSIQQELANYRQQIARPALMKANVIDPIIREIYARQAEEIEVSHILIRVDENASPADTLAAYQKWSRSSIR